MKVQQSLGVFCVEGWSSDLRMRSTVRPLLELMEREAGIRYIYQRVASMEELRTYLGYWSGYESYPLGYLAFHGDEGEVSLGSETSTVEELIDTTTDSDDPTCLNLAGKVVYFGSCETMGEKAMIKRFKEDSGARLVCGYTESVDWLESAAFELLLMSRLADNKDPVAALELLYSRHGGLVKRLGFTSVPKPT